MKRMRRSSEKPPTMGVADGGRGRKERGSSVSKAHKPTMTIDLRKVLIGKLTITAQPNTTASVEMKAVNKKSGLSNRAKASKEDYHPYYDYRGSKCDTFWSEMPRCFTNHLIQPPLLLCRSRSICLLGHI
jgi:hypothetical protein